MARRTGREPSEDACLSTSRICVKVHFLDAPLEPNAGDFVTR